MEIKEAANDWFYSPEVKKHFINPQNFLQNEKDIKGFNGYGKVGNIKCGDLMEMWVKIEKDKKGELKIKKCKWRTFGCASAIASTSMLSTMITEKNGMNIEKAKQIKAKDIMDRLGGLPAIKVHCSVLGDQALQKAIEDFEKKNKKQFKK
jgi:nitrogen fixation NifU-like protein/NifU-like protein